VDEETKKRLVHEMKRIFQESYDNLIEEIERLKKELAPGDNLHKRQFVLQNGDVGIMYRALQKYKAGLEHFYKGVKHGTDAHYSYDLEIEATKWVIAIVEDVLYGRGTLVFKRSA